MARRSSLLTPAVTAKSKLESQSATARVETAALPWQSGGKRPGKYHLGAYFDPADSTAEAFRVLVARTRHSHQDLLAEVIAELVAKYEANKQFGRS